MTATFSQISRSLEIQTPLGENVLGLRSILLQERLGRPFVLEAELSSDDPEVSFDAIIGQPVAVRLDLGGGSQRFFHAFVSRFSYVGQGPVYTHYRATLVPWLWVLTRSADCRIFQNVTLPDIVQTIFRDRGAKDFESRLTETYPSLEYCVQYRETDFNFVSRLLEQEGISYFFKHEVDKATLALVDSMDAYENVAGYEELRFAPVLGAERQMEVVTRWTVEREVQPTQFAFSDYNFLTPKTDLRVLQEVQRSHAINDRQIFDYPGEYRELGQGERLAKMRLEELQTAGEVVRAETTFFGLSAGNTFSLTEHPRADQNRKYLVTSLDLFWDAGEFSSQTDALPESHCTFTAIPASQTFRPARITPKPLIQGTQPAVVAGPEDEEIHTDAHGRVKVHFFWNREGKADETSSCWIRVAQSWAGKGWGGIFLPRRGQEVVVVFEEGDPDRPLIIGSLYNSENTPPYELPAERTKSTVKSNSSKGGGGFNEIRFEDKKGEEQVFIHAEKNQDIRIKNDEYEWVGNDRHLIVKNNQLEHVEGNRHELVDGQHSEKVGKDRNLHVVGKEAKAVDESLSLTVKGDVIEVFKKNHSEATTGDYYLKASNIVIEATTNITIKVGSTYIAIEAGGIKISAPQVEIEGLASLEAKSPLTTVKGDVTLTLKGAVVLIN